MAIYLNEAGQQKTVYSSKDGLYYDRQGNRLFAKPDNYSSNTITSESLTPTPATNFEPQMAMFHQEFSSMFFWSYGIFFSYLPYFQTNHIHFNSARSS